jgi:hypothetical protein
MSNMSGIPSFSGGQASTLGEATSTGADEQVDWSALSQEYSADKERIHAEVLGRRPVEVVNAYFKPASSGSPMWKLKYRLLDGGTYDLREDQIVLTRSNPTATKIFFKNMEAFGLQTSWFISTNPSNAVVAQTLIGKRVWVTIKEDKTFSYSYGNYTAYTGNAPGGMAIPAPGGIPSSVPGNGIPNVPSVPSVPAAPPAPPVVPVTPEKEEAATGSVEGDPF